MKASNLTTKKDFTFPVGYHSFHKNRQLNFRIYHLYSLGYWTKTDAQWIGASIREVGECQRDLVAFAEQKDSEGQMLTAAFGYRAAELFIHPNDPDKMALYDKFYDRFYTAVQDQQMEQYSIPYQNGALPLTSPLTIYTAAACKE